MAKRLTAAGLQALIREETRRLGRGRPLAEGPGGFDVSQQTQDAVNALVDAIAEDMVNIAGTPVEDVDAMHSDVQQIIMDAVLEAMSLEPA